MKKRNKDIIVVGFALFAMFFGAGNLIFPPSIGKEVGSMYPISILGFLITGVGLPLAGIIASVKSGGNITNMANRVGRKFSIIITFALILTIGPLLAIPRTAATTHELAIGPFFPSLNPIVTIIIYFIINFAFVINPSSIVDNIGKILTPLLLIILSVIILKGVLFPIGPIINTGFRAPFSNSLIQGYQTMDAMGSIILASIVITSIKGKGYNNKTDIISMTVKSGIVAVFGLAFIYGGLMYLGTQTSTLLPLDVQKTQLVTEIAKRTLGAFGSVSLGIAVGLACLTTSIGLTATAADYFSKLSNNKLSYKTNSILITVLSIVIASLGVDKIVSFAGPILMILYPVIIVFIIIGLLGNVVRNDKVVAYTVYVTLMISVLDTLKSLEFLNNKLSKIIDSIPLSSIGFAWVIPSLVTFTTAYIIFNNSKDNKREISELSA